MSYQKAQLMFPQLETVNGVPAEGYTVNSYIWDTSTPLAMYTSATGSGAATSFTLNSSGITKTAGGTPCDIFLHPDKIYKFIVKDASGVQFGPTIGPVYGSGLSYSTIRVADSLADAEAISPIAEDQLVMTLGYATPGDKGHALYRYDGADLVPLILSTVNLNMFGADPTGVADSYPALLAAYNFGCARIELGDGSYKFTEFPKFNRGLIFSGALAQDGSNGNGQSVGDYCTQINYTGSGEAIVLDGSGAGAVEGIRNIHLSDFVLTGTSAAKRGIVVGETNVSQCSIKRVLVNGFSQSSGSDSNGVYGAGVHIRNSIMCLFEQVYCHGNAYDWHIRGVATSHTFIACQGRVAGKDGWFIEQLLGSSFYECLAEGNTQSGINIKARAGQSVTNLNFFSWYSEQNSQDLTTPPVIIDADASGLTAEINFHAPYITDYNTAEILRFRKCFDVRMEKVSLNNTSSGFATCTSNTSDCVITTRAAPSPTLITNNTYEDGTGRWRVQLIDTVPADIRPFVGTWVPNVSSGMTGIAGMEGSYEKIGGFVFYRGSFTVTNITNVNVVIDNMPFKGRNRTFGTLRISGGVTANFAYVEDNTTELGFNFSSTYSGSAQDVYFHGFYMARDV